MEDKNPQISKASKFMSFNKIAVLVFVAIIILAHVVVSIIEPATYLWYKNSISDLAAQGYSYNWIMRIGFWCFGGILIAGVSNKFFVLKRMSGSDLFVLLYGIFIFFTGIFRIKPFISIGEYSVFEDELHSLFATLTGFSISMGIMFSVFPITKEGYKRSIINIILALLVVGCSALFGVFESAGSLFVGGVQRMTWFFGLLWLYYLYTSD